MTHRPFVVPVFVAALAAACQSSPTPTQDRAVSGTGLVVGLDKTGSSDRETREAILAFARDNGLTLQVNDIVEGAVAVVRVTAAVPVGATAGQVVDVRCEAMDAAVSLRGGQLLRCELRDANGNTLALAQGPVAVPTAAPAAETSPAPASPFGRVLGGVVVR